MTYICTVGNPIQNGSERGADGDFLVDHVELEVSYRDLVIILDAGLAIHSSKFVHILHKYCTLVRLETIYFTTLYPYIKSEQCATCPPLPLLKQRHNWKYILSSTLCMNMKP